MHVALIIERIEAWRGGAETSTMQSAGYLARGGCQVSVLTTSHAPSTPEINMIPIKASGAFRAAKTFLFARRAAEYVRTHDFDIVHSITPCPVADVYQPRGGTVPETLARNVALRKTGVQRGFKRLGQRLSLKYQVVAGLERRLLVRDPPPWVIAISQYVSDQLQHHYGFDSSRIRSVFNGVDPDRTSDQERRIDRTQVRRQFELADDDLVMLCIAHNFKLKGVGSLIQALARCPEERIHALIVGRDNPTPFVTQAKQLGIADRVIFAGPTRRIPAFFHAADLLVHPTFYDPCSRVVLEALAAGLPVVTTRFNGAAERITDGQQGYVIETPTDIDALADRIDRLCDDDHRRACAAQAVQAVVGISMQEHANKIRTLYEDILRNGCTERRMYR